MQFDSPDRYGKGLDWTGYTVHDAANILRRYFNQLPEPIIPLEFYERFREPLRNHQAQAVGQSESQSPSVGDFNSDVAIRQYQNLITDLPPLNRQLLLYILDLLAVFASKSDLNKMTTANLAAIFQPGILSHPQHDMAPPEYRLSQDVLIFLIENQDNFLIGMQGTEADPQTVKEVQSGAPSPTKAPTTPTTPGRSKTIVGRSSSTASVGAESVRKWGNIRRNVSVSSSKHSSKKSEGGPTPVTPAIGSPSTPSSGVHRSNTVPSRRGGSNNASPRFSREKNTSDPATPSPATVAVAAAVVDGSRPKQDSIGSTPTTITAPQFPTQSGVASASSSEATTPLAAVGSNTPSDRSRDYQTPKKDTTPLLSPPGGGAEHYTERSPSNTPSATGKGFGAFWKQSPGSDSDGRKPKKLQKKRIPGTSLSSAQSSNQSLDREQQSDVQMSPATPTSPQAVAADQFGEKTGEHSTYATAQTTPTNTGLDVAQATPQRHITDATLRPNISPAHSFHSTNDMSDADLVGDDLPKEQSLQPEKERKRYRWRLSRTQNKLDQSSPQPSQNPLGTMTSPDQMTSRSTFGSTTSQSQPRRSFQEPTPLAAVATDPTMTGSPKSPPMQPSGTDPVFSDSEKEKRGGLTGWIRGKMRDHKEKEAEKRARTPDRSRDPRESKQDLQLPTEPMPVRGKSFDAQRGNSQASIPTQTTMPMGAVASEQQRAPFGAPRAPPAIDPSAAAAPKAPASSTTTSPATTESSPESAAPRRAASAATNGTSIEAQEAKAESAQGA